MTVQGTNEDQDDIRHYPVESVLRQPFSKEGRTRSLVQDALG